jgi:uncharacterized protein YfaS (alpha-2-macroglobulin family)
VERLLGLGQRAAPRKRFSWIVFDDRKLYKPKEEVRIKGWLRVVDYAPRGGVSVAPAAVKQLRFQVYGPRGNKVGQGSAVVGKLGGFDFKFKLPDNVNLGYARVNMSVAGGAVASSSHRHSFQIQEFRRPEFEVSTTASAGPHFLGGFGQFTASAKYLSGGGLAGAAVTWRVTSRGGSYHPPKNSGFTFVGWRPSWWRKSGYFRSSYKTFKGTTDGKGVHRLRVNLEQLRPARPAVVRATAVIQDINRQTLTSSSQFIVHPSSVSVCGPSAGSSRRQSRSR